MAILLSRIVPHEQLVIDHAPLGDPAPARGRRIAGRRVRAPRAGPSALARLHPLGRGQDPVKEAVMVWRITHYPAVDAPSRDYAVRAPTLEAAKRKLAAAINVPLRTLR